jgi:hypothetical protein
MPLPFWAIAAIEQRPTHPLEAQWAQSAPHWGKMTTQDGRIGLDFFGDRNACGLEPLRTA